MVTETFEKLQAAAKAVATDVHADVRQSRVGSVLVAIVLGYLTFLAARAIKNHITEK